MLRSSWSVIRLRVSDPTSNTRRAEGEQARGVHQRVDEPGARGVEVAGAAGDAQAMLDLRRRRGHLTVGCRGREQHLVDRGGVDPGVVEGGPRRVDGESGGGATDAPLLDARAFGDPRVGGVEARFEIGVGDDVVGQSHTPAGDADAAHQPTRSHATGSVTETRSPADARTPITVPAKGERTSTPLTVPIT